MTTVWHLCGYDKQTETIAEEHRIPEALLPVVRTLVDAVLDDRDLVLPYDISPENARRLAAILGATANADAYDYTVECGVLPDDASNPSDAATGAGRRGARPLPETVIHELCGFDKATDVLAVEFVIPRELLPTVRTMVEPEPDDHDLVLCYDIAPENVRRLTALMGVTVDENVYNFAVECSDTAWEHGRPSYAPPLEPEPLRHYVAYELVAYDPTTCEPAARYPVPGDMLPFVRSLVDYIRPDDDLLLPCLIESHRVIALATVLGLQLDVERFFYHLDGIEAPADAGPAERLTATG